MRTRHVFIGVFFSLGPFVLESCSSDSTSFTPVESGGEGGAATGKGGAGAVSGKGGSGASSGRGGSGGDAGSPTSSGGSAGDAQGGNGEGAEGGDAGGNNAGTGEAGSGLVSGGGGERASGGEAGGAGVPLAGGAPGTGGANGGDGGRGEGGSDAGAGGLGTPDAPKSCGYECAVDDDCDSPGILQYLCDSKTKRCAAPELTCSGHRDCVAFASSWTIACEDDDDCLSTADVCVDAGGYGRCAREFGQTCPLPEQVSVTRTRFGTLEDVEVCGRTIGRCGDGRCFLGCGGPGDCGTGDGDSCDVESGRCTCIADSECTGGAISHCNPRTQRCDECDNDFDCFLDETRDQCVEGRCGCSSANVCSDVIFPAATPVCE